DRLDVRRVAVVVAAVGLGIDVDARTRVGGEPVGGGGVLSRLADRAPTSPQLLGSGEGRGVGGRLHPAPGVEAVARGGGQADQGVAVLPPAATSAPRGVPNSARSCHMRRMVARSRHSGDAAARHAVFIGRAPVPAESFDPQSLCETRSDADRLTIRRRRGHSPPERIWTYPLAPVSAGSRPYCPATKPHVVPGTHRPPLQTSPPVQLFPSEQGAALLVWTQPVAELQVSSVHTFPSSQLCAGP